MAFDYEQFKAVVLDVAKYVKEHVTDPSLSEEDTKTAFINPILTALGWTIGDLSRVRMEGKAEAGYPDYKLLDGKPLVYVEAKALKESLDKSAHQPVNYANTDGVEWCVLTNGNEWRLYQSKAKGHLLEMLVFEIKLTDALNSDETAERITDTLAHLSRSSVISGDLEKWATTILVDTRVKAAVDKLLAEPTQKFVNALYEVVRKWFDKKAIKPALLRLYGQPPIAPPTKVKKVEQQVKGVKKPKQDKTTYEFHFAKKPESVRQLYQQLHGQIMGLADEGVIKQTFLKKYIAYSVRENFTEVVVMAKGLKLFVELPYSEIPEPSSIVRDVTSVGHWGTGNTEVKLESSDDLDYVMSIIKLAYDKTLK